MSIRLINSVHIGGGSALNYLLPELSKKKVIMCWNMVCACFPSSSVHTQNHINTHRMIHTNAYRKRLNLLGMHWEFGVDFINTKRSKFEVSNFVNIAAHRVAFSKSTVFFCYLFLVLLPLLLALFKNSYYIRIYTYFVHIFKMQ